MEDGGEGGVRLEVQAVNAPRGTDEVRASAAWAQVIGWKGDSTGVS